MDWVVTVSASKAGSGEIAPETEAAAHAAFDEHGCVLLRGIFPPATIEAMHQEYVAQFGTLDLAAMQREAERPGPNRFLQVGDARYDITLRMIGAFARPDVFANGRLLKILGPLLGNDVHLSNLTVVASHPKSTTQHVHRDHPHLFLNPGADSSLPVYAINVAVPLIDVDIETGPTGVWLGSHRWLDDNASTLSAPTVCSWQRGDCMLLDYRTLHAGLPNRSGRVRPIVYIVYARRWFFDHGNHVRRIPLDMPLEHYNEIPASVRPLLIRAFSYATLTRWGEVDARAPAVPPSANAPSHAGRVGRNDPCPCGAGKKYKHCHGRLA
jgi:ectoine hydroxylase-related dioxygenase (phytanoyl-CoA dioxygenase family)